MATKPKAAKVPARSATKKSPAPATTFSLLAPEAKEVFLVGDFNDWRPGELKARKLKNGIWRKALTLKPGSYQYLFVVDGRWWTDPDNPVRVANPFGTENSLIAVS